MAVDCLDLKLLEWLAPSSQIIPHLISNTYISSQFDLKQYLIFGKSPHASSAHERVYRFSALLSIYRIDLPYRSIASILGSIDLSYRSATELVYRSIVSIGLESTTELSIDQNSVIAIAAVRDCRSIVSIIIGSIYHIDISIQGRVF